MGSFVCLESLCVLGVCVLGFSCSYETSGPGEGASNLTTSDVQVSMSSSGKGAIILTTPGVQVSTSSLVKGAINLTTPDVQVSTLSFVKGAINLTTPGVQVSTSSLVKGAINLTTTDVQVSMSSVFLDLDATKAIDGRFVGDPEKCNCCSETKQNTSSWWQVDLGRPFFVKQLIVYARNDENIFKHLVGFSVFTSLTAEFPQTAVFTSQDQTIQDNKVVVDLPDVAARFVRIQRAGVLTICEIEIIHLDFNCPVHTYGRECAPCGPCYNGSCDPVIGVCPYGCYDGYIGNKCETFDPVTTKVTFGFVGAGALAGLLIVVAVVIGAVLLVKNRRIQIYEQTMVKWTKGPTTNDSEYCTLDEQEKQRRVTIEVKPAEESATDEPELMKEIGPELRLTGFDILTSCLDRVEVK